MKIGFLVNPIAGMGGAVGLKGTDNQLYFLALRKGAKPVAPKRAERFLSRLLQESFRGFLIVANGVMGCDYMPKTRLSYKCLKIPTCSRTTKKDTADVVKEMIKENVDLIVFVGGDGTARDILDVIDGRIPILGVPSGVKMYSGVFAVSPEAAAEVVRAYAEGKAEIIVTNVADADEEAINRGLLKVKVYGLAKAPAVEQLITPTKDFGSYSDSEAKKAIAEYFRDEYIKPNNLYLLGPGTTIKALADILKIEKTLLGIDALWNNSLVGKDLDEEGILDLLSKYRNPHIVITIIGAQGYIFGRGNQQLSPKVIRTVGKERIHILATPSKLVKIKYLLIDTGDSKLDIELSGYYRIITGYREETVLPAYPACCVDDFILKRKKTR